MSVDWLDRQPDENAYSTSDCDKNDGKVPKASFVPTVNCSSAFFRYKGSRNPLNLALSNGIQPPRSMSAQQVSLLLYEFPKRNKSTQQQQQYELITCRCKIPSKQKMREPSLQKQKQDLKKSPSTDSLVSMTSDDVVSTMEREYFDEIIDSSESNVDEGRTMREVFSELSNPDLELALCMAENRKWAERMKINSPELKKTYLRERYQDQLDSSDHGLQGDDFSRSQIVKYRFSTAHFKVRSVLNKSFERADGNVIRRVPLSDRIKRAMASVKQEWKAMRRELLLVRRTKPHPQHGHIPDRRESSA